jgi:hypothetical protein
MSANDLRGEVAITLEGVDYVMRPSYEAIVAVERQTECSLSLIRISAMAETLALENAAIVVTEFVRAQGRAMVERGDQAGAPLTEFNKRRIGEALLETGLKSCFDPIAIVIGRAITGGYTASGEAKAARVEQKPTPAAV